MLGTGFVVLVGLGVTLAIWLPVGSGDTAGKASSKSATKPIAAKPVR